MILALVIASRWLKASVPFDRDSGVGVWIWLHGLSLLVGTMLVSLGMTVALMYLVQAWRLKSKVRGPGLLRLPSLEYLQTLGSHSIWISTMCVAIGLLSGVALNLQTTGRVSWFEGGILFSGPLLLWLVVACIAQSRLSKRDLGRWIAYLNIGNFAFMAIALWLVIGTPHGRTSPKPSAPTGANPAEHDPTQELRP
jgi:hypothetical protein